LTQSWMPTFPANGLIFSMGDGIDHVDFLMVTLLRDYPGRFRLT